MGAFPKEYSLIEQYQAQAIIDEAARVAQAYAGNFTAPWLLSPVDALVWRISKGEQTRVVDGVAVDVYEYNWATQLYDGTNLADPINRQFRIGLQKLAFLARELPGGPDTLSTTKNFLWSLNLLTRWVFVHGEELNPRRFGLTKLSRHHFVDFFTDFAKGGSVFALRYPERLLQKLYPPALGRQPAHDELSNPVSLNPADCARVTEWLRTNRMMHIADRSNGELWTVKKAPLAEMIGADVLTLRGGPRWKAFLRQFDWYAGGSGDAQRNRWAPGRREFPTQKMLALEEAREAGVSEKSMSKYFDDFQCVVALHRHLPDVCPDPMAFSSKEIRQVIIEVSQEPGHTPWVPLNIAMTYTTEALRWVHVYSEDLVAMFLNAYQALYARGLLVSAPDPGVENPEGKDYVRAYAALSAAREAYVAELTRPAALEPLNLSGWASYVHLDGTKGFEKMQTAPSLLDAIMIFIGAVSVVVGMVKPMRESEFRALKRDCLLHVSGDGYWLSQDVRKKNVGDVRPLDARPIPVIAAKALQLLGRLTDGLKDIVGTTDPWLLDSLLALPSFGRYEAAIDSTMSAFQLTSMLDAFCDYVALPPDKKGRRWYLRMHEMRKSFLITFFWTYRYASLDTARWIAGHADAGHLYAYIQANFPGEELPGLEAEYASQVLRDYQQTGETQGVKDAEALHQAVCRHFAVRDVSWIDEGMLRDWLELQFETGEFEIIPYSIKNPDGGVTTEIAFRVDSIENKRQ